MARTDYRDRRRGRAEATVSVEKEKVEEKIREQGAGKLRVDQRTCGFNQLRSFRSQSNVSNVEFLSLLTNAASFKRKIRSRANLTAFNGRVIGELFE